MRLLPLVLSLGSALAFANTLEGRVVGVHDGDTLTLLVPGHVEHRIRLQSIDAPELGQAYGNTSMPNLSRMAYPKEARAAWPKLDCDKRLVCKLWVQPEDCPSCGLTLDIGHAQIPAGMAWWYRKYANEQTPEDRA